MSKKADATKKKKEQKPTEDSDQNEKVQVHELTEPENEKANMLSRLIDCDTRVVCIKDINVRHGADIAMHAVKQSIISSTNKEKEIAVLICYPGLPITGIITSSDSLTSIGAKVKIKEPVQRKGIVQARIAQRELPINNISTLLTHLATARSFYPAIMSYGQSKKSALKNVGVEVLIRDYAADSSQSITEENMKIVIVAPTGLELQFRRDVDNAIKTVRTLTNFSIDMRDQIGTQETESDSTDNSESESDEQQGSGAVSDHIQSLLQSAIKRTVLSSSGETTADGIIRVVDPLKNISIVLLQTDDATEVQAGIPTIDTSIGHSTNIQENIVENEVFREFFSKLDEKERKKVEEIIYADIDNTAMISKIQPEFTLDRIGGYEEIKQFISNRRNLILKHDKELIKRNILLKGIFMFGVPGCGKTTIAKCVGNEFGIPAYQLNIETGFDKLFGVSESNLLRSLNLLEQRGRVAIVIDEIDKLFAGVATGQTGNDVPIRLFGILLQYMARDNGLIFCVTANAMNLPPEFTRKGRFDRIFFIDVPTEKERERIADLYINKHGLKGIMTPELKKLLVSGTSGYTGADVENAIKEIAIGTIMEKDKSKLQTIVNGATRVSKSAISKEHLEEMRRTADMIADNKIAK